MSDPTHSFYTVYTITNDKINIYFVGDKNKCLEFLVSCQEFKKITEKLNSFIGENKMNIDFIDHKFTSPMYLGRTFQCQ